VKTLNNPRSLAAVFLLAMLVFTLIPHVYSSTLALTVFTTKPSYFIADDITVYGILTYNGSPVPSWPVAIEIQDPLGTPVVTRTAQTNTSGTYILTFKLPTNARLGTYAVYVSAGYKGETAANSTTFVIGPVHNIDTHLSYMTIQAAIDASETLDGHTIFVRNGTYYEYVVVDKSVSLIGENRETTIIDGNGTGNVVCAATNNVGISSFAIQNSGHAGPNHGIYIMPNMNGISLNDNIVTNNQYGISMDSHSSENTLLNSTITENEIGIILFDNSSQNIVTNNNIANNAYGIYLLYSFNNTISNNRVADNDYDGIFMSSADNNSISNNNIIRNYYGISARLSVGNSITSNNISYSFGPGLYLTDGSNSSVIAGNIVTFNWHYGIGIFYNSSNNDVSGNVITDNGLTFGAGVSVLFSDANAIINNAIINNRYGLGFQASFGNSIYHNNFINNTNQVDNQDSTNMWDDGYPSGGNYWSDYSGTDSYRGSHQNETGSDGIGDAPYAIDENNQDNYPFMKPYPWSSHDIGITGITTSRTIVGQGFNLSINTTIFNYGDNTETFNVTVYCNETAITLRSGENYTTVTLTSGESRTVAIAWNTSGFAKGNYTIWAYAWPVLGETDTADNNFTGGWVLVTIPGDLNGDLKVSLADLVILAIAYGSRPGDTGWNPKADIDGNNVVGLSDLVILANHYGQQFP
jgi:parallel beta-helix repeat protein